MRLVLAGFDWDSGNRNKCRKHGLSEEWIESILKGEVHIIADKEHMDVEERYIAIGKIKNGRGIFIGFTYRVKNNEIYLRPITARFMHQKELEKYEKATSKI